MGGTPFHTEIEAYSRLTGAEPDAWEVSMLRLLLCLRADAADKKSKAGKSAPKNEASDGVGVASLMRGLGAKKA